MKRCGPGGRLTAKCDEARLSPRNAPRSSRIVVLIAQAQLEGRTKTTIAIPGAERTACGGLTSIMYSLVAEQPVAPSAKTRAQKRKVNGANRREEQALPR